MFNNQYYEMESFRNKVVDVETLHETTIEDLRFKFEKETEDKVKQKISNIEERVNDIEAKLWIGVCDQLEKLSELEDVMKSIKHDKESVNSKEAMIAQIGCMVENIACLAKDVETIKTETVEDLKTEMKGKSNDLKNVEESGEIVLTAWMRKLKTTKYRSQKNLTPWKR